MGRTAPGPARADRDRPPSVDRRDRRPVAAGTDRGERRVDGPFLRLPSRPVHRPGRTVRRGQDRHRLPGQQYVHPQSRSILIDGVKAGEYSARSCSDMVGLVTQEPLPLHESTRRRRTPQEGGS